MVTLLIQAGADVNKADKDGQTPLTLAEKRDTLIKSRREKRRELVERNQDYRNALRCDPYFFPKMGTDTHGYSPQDAIWRMDICSDAILDMLRKVYARRVEKVGLAPLVLQPHMTTLPSWSVNTVLVPSPAHTFFSNNSGGSLNAFPVAFATSCALHPATTNGLL